MVAEIRYVCRLNQLINVKRQSEIVFAFQRDFHALLTLFYLNLDLDCLFVVFYVTEFAINCNVFYFKGTAIQHFTCTRGAPLLGQEHPPAGRIVQPELHERWRAIRIDTQLLRYVRLASQHPSTLSLAFNCAPGTGALVRRPRASTALCTDRFRERARTLLLSLFRWSDYERCV